MDSDPQKYADPRGSYQLNTANKQKITLKILSELLKKERL